MTVVVDSAVPICAPPAVLPAAVERAPRRAHLIGINGTGMAALAQVLDDWGWRLSGSDRMLGPIAQHLAARHAALHQGHAAAQVPGDAELVVYSDAIPPDNVERRQATAGGIPTCSYFELVGCLTQPYRLIAFAGTHGKSTTTALAREIFRQAGLDPLVFCGAAALGAASGGRGGRGPWALVEACEYRANFLRLRPELAVILGIEADHFDCYASLDDVRESFARFARRVPSQGRILVRHDCATSRRAVAQARCAVETFGLAADADWSAQRVEMRQGRAAFRLVHRGNECGEISLAIPGRHNVLNALAAAAAGHYAQIAGDAIAAGVAAMTGLQRRLERLTPWRGVERWDDYAHHPTEVAASLETLRQLYPGRRLWTVFQPHQASRTARLLDEFAASLDNTDEVLLAEIFRAREPAAGPHDVTVADLAARVRARGKPVPALHDPDAVARRLRQALRPGDVLVTLGAGDIRRVQQCLAPAGRPAAADCGLRHLAGGAELCAAQGHR